MPIYVGTNKIKKIFHGTTKIKKVYAGTQLVYSSEPQYYGEATPLYVGRAYLAATTVGNYALFGGGSLGLLSDYGNSVNTVNAYNTSLTRSTPTSLRNNRATLAATTVGNYALFGGAHNPSYGKNVDAYNTSLTRSTVTEFTSNKGYLAATTIGNYAIFGSGYVEDKKPHNGVDAYSNTLVKTSTSTNLQEEKSEYGAITIGNYALFGGGAYGASPRSSVDAYDSNLVRSIPTSLSLERYEIATATVGNYAIFAGGRRASSSSTVDAYNTSLVRSTPTALSKGARPKGVSSEDYALFAGYGITTMYDSSLVQSTLEPAIESRYLAATTIGNYALFGGGTTALKNVYVFEI